MEYQQTPIEPGKWYVSDTGPSFKGPPPGKRKQIQGRDDQRLAGPCDSETDAEAKRKQLVVADARLKGTRLYVWQADYGEHPPERMELVFEILDVAFRPEGNFKIYPPASVVENVAVLDAPDVVGRLLGTEWQLRFPDETVRPVEFVDLIVILFNIRKLKEDHDRAREKLREEGQTEGEVKFTISADLDKILPSDKVRALLRSVRLELGPIPDPGSDEPKLRELFNDGRMKKCGEVWRRIFNNWSLTRVFDCRIVADESIDGKSVEELGKLYLSIGAANDLTRLPFLDALIVLDMLKQFNVNFHANGTHLEKFQVKTEYTQSEVYELLDEIRRAGIPVVVEPLK